MTTRRQAWAVALVATLTMTVSYIDRSTLAVLAPSVTRALSIDETEYGWLTSAFSLAYLLATPLSGWWIDRVGARRGLVGSVLAWTAVAAAHAVVPGFGALLALRIALGVTEGPSFPGAAQAIQRALPADERARGFGVLFTGSSLGGMLVPPLASALFAAGGWRLAFLGTALAGLVWLPAWLVVTRGAHVRARLDHGDAGSPEEARPSGMRALLVDRDMVRALCAIAAIAPVFGFALGWGAKYLARAFDVAQADVGRYLWLPPLVMDACAIAAGDLGSRLRRAPGVPPRLLVSIGGVLAVALVALPLATTPWQGVTVVAVSMGGAGIVYTLVTADLLSRVAPAGVSLASGTLAGAQSLALIVVNPLIGASVDRLARYDAAAVAIGAWAIPGCLVWLVVRPRR